MNPNSMNIRQAARWADRNDCLYRVDHRGEPEYLYAVYDTGTLMVECIGTWEKCQAHFVQHGSDRFSSTPTRDGRWLRCEALQTIVEQMDESEGEMNCLPGARELAWGDA